MITVTDVKFHPVKLEKGLVGFASCVVNEAIYIGSIGVFSRLDKQGYRLVFPVRTSSKGNKFKIFFPINSDIYGAMLNAILQKIE